MSARLDTCRLCPRLCRHACPVATGTGREAAVPTQIADVIMGWREGRLDRELAIEAATLCVDCGRCQEACHLHQPLPALLAQARRELLGPRAAAPVGEVEGTGELVAIEADRRPWAAWLAAVRGEPVARLVTSDALGASAAGGPGWRDHLDRLLVRLAGRLAVVADGATAAVLEASDTRWTWLHVVVPDLGELRPGCTEGALTCCGGGEPLRSAHPDDAAQLARRWVRDGLGPVADARCGAHLRGCGHDVADAVELLRRRAGAPA